MEIGHNSDQLIRNRTDPKQETESRVKFDLHCHSYFSDGILSPENLVSRAKEHSVDVLALTDHDSVAGVVSAQLAAAECGIQIITGIEFSSQWGKAGVHVVGLGVDLGSTVLLEAIEQQSASRRLRAEQIAQRLVKFGFSQVLEGAQKIAGNAEVARPHFAQYLVEIGAVKNINAAFKKYLGTGKSADVKYVWPHISTVIEWIHSAGGQAVLAHPLKYEFTRTKMCALVKDFAEAGGDALEVISGQQSWVQTQDLASIAAANNLSSSCGSDFHTPQQTWQELGRFSELPETCVPVWQKLGFN